MTHHILSLADISPLAWMTHGLMEINTSLMVLGFSVLLLGFMFTSEFEDHSDMY